MGKHQYSNELLNTLVPNCTSISQVCEKLGIPRSATRSHTHISKRIKELGLDLTHFKIARLELFKTVRRSEKKSLNEILKINTSVNSSNLRKRLLQEGLLINECALCGQMPEWRGKPLVLQLDHINGNRRDNRLENLRILCPHCHTQTETYANKRGGVARAMRESIKTKLRRPRPRKVERPSYEELAIMINTIPTTHIASKYGVSDKAVEKWCKCYGIQKPPRGYWAKRRSFENVKGR